jgi:glycosyltransferase involved in cell wall biosynthesis
MRIAFCLPGLHRVGRGAEVAFESIARALAVRNGNDVTLIGSGQPRTGDPYRFLHAPCLPRERFESWPTGPVLRSDCHYEELTFLPAFAKRYDPSAYDIVVTCSYPFVNWAVRTRSRLSRQQRPTHVFVTENGDWPLRRQGSEFKYFDCDALVCINPEYHEEHGHLWPSALIPNGVDVTRFGLGAPERERFGLPTGVPLVLIVSALIPSKRVDDGIRAVAKLEDVHLVVAGNGPERDAIDALGRDCLGPRYRRLVAAHADMPALYRSVDLMLHMSTDEPFGNIYVEALATGTPIVTHDRPTTRWALTRFGHFTNTLDLDAVAQAVKAALRAPRERDAAAEEARRRFDWRVVAGQYDDFFRTLRVSARSP